MEITEESVTYKLYTYYIRSGISFCSVIEFNTLEEAIQEYHKSILNSEKFKVELEKHTTKTTRERLLEVKINQ